MTFNYVTKTVIEQHNSLARYLFPHSFRMLLGIKTTENLDEKFFEKLKTLGLKSLIECGANDASASVMANKIDIEALAIEANPETYEKVTPSSNERFTKLNFGLGAKAGSLKFYIPKQSSTAKDATFRPKKGVDYHVFNVPVKKLDEILKETRYIKSPFAVWIDVEGMQDEVLSGALDTLKNENCKMIKIEVEELELFQGQKWLSRDVTRYLEKLDFEVIYRDFEYQKQYNMLFLRRDTLDIAESELPYTGKVIGIKDCIFYLAKHKNFKREVKALVLLLLGENLGNRIAARAGSKASKEYIKRR